jgi:protein SCO1/2
VKSSHLLSVLAGIAISLAVPAAEAGPVSTAQPSDAVRTFTVHGVVMALKPAEQIVVIRHEAISNYMEGMTMPFKAADSNILSSLTPGDQVTFHLHVTDSESRVDDFVKTGFEQIPAEAATPPPQDTSGPPHVNSLLDYKFTNELGRAVSLNDFRGQAVGITFFYTRCPLPDYCPRLSKNFQMACAKLKARPDAPVNWHFLSISFDPEFDTPAMLEAYAAGYQADPAHWDFLTGPPDKIAELAHASGVNYRLRDGSYDHNFRTLIIDANGNLQTVFPTGGDLSDMIVGEMIKAAGVTNQSEAKSVTSSR